MNRTNAQGQTIAKLYFNDGCVARKDYAYIAGRLKHLDRDEYTYSRMTFCKDWKWGYHDLSWNVISVCYSDAPALMALSERGDVCQTDRQGQTHTKIADVETLGAAKQIRQIGQHLYVCGDQGQVYRRDGDTWGHVDDGILDRKVAVDALDLNGIDGTSEEDIYVVGFRGRVLHFDGRSWTELDSPTNVPLERVRCVARDEVYICGNEGTFYRLSNGAFEDFSVKGMKDHFWGLAPFEGKVYISALEGLYVFDGTGVEPADTKLDPPIGGYRLDARGGQLWSFGVDDLAYFDGSSWSRVIDPDNA